MTFVLGAFFIWQAFSDDGGIAGGPGFGVTETLLLCAGIINALAALLGRNLLLGWLLCQVSLAGSLAVAELGLRLTVAPRYMSPYQLNDRYLYELVPDAVREHRHLPINGGSQIYRVNKLGFRGEEFSPERAAGPRIVIYGDSFIHAEYTALENTLAKQLLLRLA